MFVKYTWPAAVWALVILVLSTMPTGGVTVPPLFGFIPADKPVHAIMYLLLSGLLLRGVTKQYEFQWWRFYSTTKVIALAWLYGLLMELLQGFVIMDRNLEFSDLLANLAGCLLGSGCYWLIKKM